MTHSTEKNNTLMTEKEWASQNLHFDPEKKMDTFFLMSEDKWSEYNMMNQSWEYPLEKFYDSQLFDIERTVEPDPIYIVRTIEEYSKTASNIYNAILQLDHTKSILLEEKRKAEEEFFLTIDPGRLKYYQNQLERDGHKKFQPLFKVSSINNRLFKIRLNSLLPLYLKTKQTSAVVYEKYQYIYQGLMTNEILQHPEIINSFSDSEKLYVKIIQFHKSKKISDLDNRFHTFIFNSLRQSGIVQDDSFMNLCYMDEGRIKNGEEYTEIFVGYHSDMNEIDKY